MLFPPARPQVAFAGGLGRALFSCAAPVAAQSAKTSPMPIHVAKSFFIFFSSSNFVLGSDSIQSNLTPQRKKESRFTIQVSFPYLFYPAWSVRAASSFVALA